MTSLPIPQTVSSYVHEFNGRTWLLPIINEWLDNGSEQIFLLTGGPGTGKSMIIGWLAGYGQLPEDSLAQTQLTTIREQVAATHFFLANSRNMTPLAFAEGIANQLTETVNQFDGALTDSLKLQGTHIEVIQEIEHVEAGATIIGMEIGKINLKGLVGNDSFDLGFVQPLIHLYENGYDQPMLLLVDGLDEALAGSPDSKLLTLLAKLKNLPKQVRILATSRPDTRILNLFTHAHQFDLVQDAPPHAADILHFASNWLQKQSALLLSEAEVEQLAQHINDKAAGIFLYAYMILQDIGTNGVKRTELGEFALPTGLSGIYHSYFTREFGTDLTRWQTQVRPALGLIAVTQGRGLTGQKLAALLDFDPTAVLLPFSQYLSGNLPNGPFRLFHKSLADFLLDDPQNELYKVDGAAMHARLVDMVAITAVNFQTMDLYDLRYLPDHFAGAGRQDELQALLLNFEYLQAKLQYTHINDLLDDFDYVASHRRQTPARLVQEALRLSAHTLAIDATQLAGQLIGRLKGMPQPELHALVAQAEAWTGTSWIRPLHSVLTAPGGAMLRTLTGHTDDVTKVSFSRTGEHLLSTSRDKSLKVWDLTSDRVLATVQDLNDPAHFEAISPNGKFALSFAWSKVLKIWDLRRYQPVATVTAHVNNVTAAAITPDGRTAVVAFYDNTLMIWNVATGTMTPLVGHTAYVSALAITPDGRQVVSAAYDATVRVWDLHSAQLVQTLYGHNGSVIALKLSADGSFAVSGSYDSSAIVWDLARGATIARFTGHRNYVTALAVTPDGEHVVSASSDQTIKLWQLTSGRELATLTERTEWVLDLAVSPDSQTAVSASVGNTIKEWDLTVRGNARPIGRGHDDAVQAVLATPDGQTAVSASLDQNVKVWDAAHQRVRHTLIGHPQKIIDAAMLPDGKRAISASYDNVLMMWDLEQGILLQRWDTQHQDVINAVALTPDGQFAITASDDMTLKAWQLSTGQLVQTFNGHSKRVVSVALTPDGERVVSAAYDNQLIVWDRHQGQMLATLAEHTAWVNKVVVTANGRFAISASWDANLIVWDLQSYHAVRTLPVGTAAVYSEPISALATLPDNQHLVTATADQTITVWHLETGRAITRFACDRNVTALTTAENGRFIIAGDQSGLVHFLQLVLA